MTKIRFWLIIFKGKNFCEILVFIFVDPLKYNIELHYNSGIAITFPPTKPVQLTDSARGRRLESK